MNKGRKFKHLTYTQRIIIETLYNRRVPVKQIAEEIGVCFKTVYNELKRGECKLKKYVSTDYIDEKKYKKVKAYSSNIAAEKYRKNMSRHGADIKLGKDYAFANYIENKIVNEKYTPLAVLGEIKAKGLIFDTTICVQTLYNYIRKGVFLNLSMKNLLFGKRTKKREKLVIKKAPSGKSIEQRPQIIAERSEFGHWEMDCVCGPRSSSFPLLVLTERKTRKELIFKIEKQTVKNVVDCLNVLERQYGKRFLKVFKSITVDNGAEFADCAGMESSIQSNKKRTTIYYCHPYRSNERGTNERMNREIRRIFPKGTNFRNISEEEIAKAEQWLNNYPRGVLNFHTPEELFNYHLSLID